MNVSQHLQVLPLTKPISLESSASQPMYTQSLQSNLQSQQFGQAIP